MRTISDTDRDLSARLGTHTFGAPVAYVYDPSVYAAAPRRTYLDRFGALTGRVLLLGMNPGPFGMAQTGVPFGDPVAVRDWMGISGPVGRPPREHPKRPVLGFESPRREASGRRLWGWAADRLGAPETFFARFFVWNYCPLLFLADGGRNITPVELTRSDAAVVHDSCDRALRDVVSALSPSHVVGVGAFAEDRARLALGDAGPPISRILHPSPASPAANTGWSDKITGQLRDAGISL